jgi:homocysteine S-methyltransferase
MNYIDEAIGIAKAAKRLYRLSDVHTSLPVVLSFTVEPDCTLPDGHTLQQAIEEVDRQTNCAPAYYMVNCAHPQHILAGLGGIDVIAPWMRRIQGVRCNASTKCHAELDTMTTLDIGDIAVFGQGYQELLRRWPWMNVLGGCCGTDTRHICSIIDHCIACTA